MSTSPVCDGGVRPNHCLFLLFFCMWAPADLCMPRPFCTSSDDPPFGDGAIEQRIYVNELHSQPHVRMGTGGDLEDVTTSPNDPIFISHHNNVDRNNFHWMHSATYSGIDVYDSFPKTNHDVRLNVVSGRAPWGISGPCALLCTHALSIGGPVHSTVAATNQKRHPVPPIIEDRVNLVAFCFGREIMGFYPFIRLLFGTWRFQRPNQVLRNNSGTN